MSNIVHISDLSGEGQTALQACLRILTTLPTAEPLDVACLLFRILADPALTVTALEAFRIEREGSTDYPKSRQDHRLYNSESPDRSQWQCKDCPDEMPAYSEPTWTFESAQVDHWTRIDDARQQEADLYQTLKDDGAIL